MNRDSRRGWDRTRGTFLDTARAVANMVNEIPDLEGPGLGTWTIAELAAHTLRAVGTPLHYGSQPSPASIDLGDAAAYYLAYLQWRLQDPDGADKAVAARGRDEAHRQDIRRAWIDTMEPAERFLSASSPDRLLATPFGGIRLIDYLPTRTVELTVHGLDIAAAAGLEWSPPQAAMTTSLAVLTAIALRSGRATDALGLLTGRSWSRDPLLR